MFISKNILQDKLKHCFNSKGGVALSSCIEEEPEKRLFADFSLTFDAASEKQRQQIIAPADGEGWDTFTWFFITMPCFELWQGRELVGLCALHASYEPAKTTQYLDDWREDDEDADALALHAGAFYINPTFAYLLAGLRGKGIGSLVANILADKMEDVLKDTMSVELSGNTELVIVYKADLVNTDDYPGIEALASIMCEPLHTIDDEMDISVSLLNLQHE